MFSLITLAGVRAVILAHALAASASSIPVQQPSGVAVIVSERLASRCLTFASRSPPWAGARPQIRRGGPRSVACRRAVTTSRLCSSDSHRDTRM